VAGAFGISERVACLELDLSVVLADVPPIVKAAPVSRFPSSDFDLAFLLADDVPAERLEKALRQGAGKLLVDIELFDVYRGTGVADGARSLAYRLRLQALDRTLTDADVAAVRDKCIAAASKLGATLRGA
jgi:phenylalanyl-tRNA synthetase beta chain